MNDPVAGAAAHLADQLGDRLQRDVPLGPMTTYRVGGRASLFVDVSSLDDLAAVAVARQLTGVPVLVVGRGSNMLVADTGFEGIAISIADLASHIDFPAGNVDGHHDAVRNDSVNVVAGGGAALPVVARRTASVGLTGFEWAVGVPGSIGGAVRMNAGGHGSDMAACLQHVRVFDMNQPGAGLQTLDVAELGLRFRASDLAPAHVVYDATLRLQVGVQATAEQEISEIVRWRREHQPGGQNCGSVFVNPVPGEVTSGALIDAAGLRGFAVGSAHVSEKHANFIQATDGGSAADVRAVIEHVRSEVENRTGYRLRSEVRLVGFDDADPLSFDEAQSPSNGREPAP